MILIQMLREFQKRNNKAKGNFIERKVDSGNYPAERNART